MEHKPQAGQRRGQRVALGVHQRLMALVHLVHHTLGTVLVEVLHLAPVIHMLLHGGQLVLHQVRVAQLGQIP